MILFNIIDQRIALYKIKKRWKSMINKRELGTNEESEEDIVVSLTSFPDRINDVSETIISLLTQDMKPSHIILWLAKEQFQNKENDLPTKLLDLKKYGLEIQWCDDLKSYKKLLPTLKIYKNSIIVTADDDVYYRTNWLKTLYESYLSDKNIIWAHRITKFSMENDEFLAIGGGKELWKQSSYLHKFTGVGGVLYPPNSLDKEVMNIDFVKKNCKTNDDIWFWLMAVKKGTKIYAPEKKQTNLIYVNDTQKGPTLTSINDKGEKLFWKDFNAVITEYPDIKKRLFLEYKKMINKQ